MWLKAHVILRQGTINMLIFMHIYTRLHAATGDLDEAPGVCKFLQNSKGGRRGGDRGRRTRMRLRRTEAVVALSLAAAMAVPAHSAPADAFRTRAPQDEVIY